MGWHNNLGRGLDRGNNCEYEAEYGNNCKRNVNDLLCIEIFECMSRGKTGLRVQWTSPRLNKHFRGIQFG